MDLSPNYYHNTKSSSSGYADDDTSIDTTSTNFSSNNNNNSNSHNNNNNNVSINSTNGCDFDRIRNMALMFFLDRMFMSKSVGREVRTLHDLSCLFGAKGFTKEMRQVVGASRSGLKKFLSAYPSLFTIDGDKVFLTQINEGPNGTNGRDYEQEAVDYFEKKLAPFGNALVPIKNLFGYRSQATQEVRHVTGQNTKDFKNFLARHEDIFETHEDYVVLKSVIADVEARGHSKAALQRVLEDDVIDPYLMKQFTSVVEKCLKNLIAGGDLPGNSTSESLDSSIMIQDHTEHPVTIEDLHNRLRQEHNNELCQKMTRTPDDLKLFLRMHPKKFKRNKIGNIEYVSLVPEHLRQEMELSSLASSTTKRGQELRRINSDEFSPLTSIMSTGQDAIEVSSITGDHSIPPPENNGRASEAKQSLKLDRDCSLNSKDKLSINSDNNITGEDKNCEGTAEQAKAANVPAGIHEQIQESTSVEQSTVQYNDQQQQQLIPRNSSLPTSKSHDERLSSTTTQSPTTGNSNLRASATPFIPRSYINPPTMTTISSTSNYATTNHLDDTRMFSLSSRSNVEPTIIAHNTIPSGPTSLNTEPFCYGRSIPQRRTINPREAVRSYLMRAVADNNGNIATNCASGPLKTFNKPANQFGSSDYNQRTSYLSRIVSKTEDADALVKRIFECTDTVGIGFNGVSSGQIKLIQLAYVAKKFGPPCVAICPSQTTSSNQSTSVNSDATPASLPEVYLIDLFTNQDLLNSLKPLIESDDVVKVIHDVRNKSNALYSHTGILIRNVFDTQVANLVIQQQETGKPAYKSRYISSNKLCEVYGGKFAENYRQWLESTLRNGSTLFKSSKNKNAKYWSTRPITEMMFYESTNDVYCIIGSVYETLRSELKAEYMSLFEQLNREGILARIKPEEIKNLKRERKTDLELIELKRKLYNKSTQYIVLSNREMRLLRHCELTDEVRSKIQQSQKVAKKLERLDEKASKLADRADRSSLTNSCDGSISNTINNSSDTSSSSANFASHDDDDDDDDVEDVDDDDGMPEAGRDNGDSDCENTFTSLIDSSMFDAIKDTIIESTDIIDAEFDSIGGSCCHCSCHKESKTVDVGVQCDLLQ